MTEARSHRQSPAAPPVEASTWRGQREHILARYFALLADEQSPLIQAGPDVEAQLAAQLFAVIDEAAGEMVDAPRSDLSSHIGRARAASGVHPSVSLAAARQIFVAALPSLTRHLQRHGDCEGATTAAVSLNAAILNRMADAAANYVGYLLDKADQAHRDEALRLSRDLHDAVGPSIAVAVQSLDLADRYRSADLERAEGKLTLARRALVEASAALRALAAETRVAVEPGGLATALTECLTHLPDEIHGKVSSQGSLDGIPTYYEREVFLILREAIRNAVAHSTATEISVRLAVAGIHLLGSVQDNGGGFETSGNGRCGTGMDSMRERAALLGAHLDVESSSTGTKILLTLPLPNRTIP